MSTFKRQFKVKFAKFLDKELSETLTKGERYSIITAIKLLKDKRTELLIHPTKNKYYIKSSDNSIFVVISTNPNEITIINHVYCYNVKLCSRAMNIIYDRFISEVDKRRTAMEEEYTHNIQNSLITVARQL